eukprot:365249-Chlamydomonas_euryale.AAC.7
MSCALGEGLGVRENERLGRGGVGGGLDLHRVDRVRALGECAGEVCAAYCMVLPGCHDARRCSSAAVASCHDARHKCLLSLNSRSTACCLRRVLDAVRSTLLIHTGPLDPPDPH